MLQPSSDRFPPVLTFEWIELCPDFVYWEVHRPYKCDLVPRTVEEVLSYLEEVIEEET